MEGSLILKRFFLGGGGHNGFQIDAVCMDTKVFLEISMNTLLRNVRIRTERDFHRVLGTVCPPELSCPPHILVWSCTEETL